MRENVCSGGDQEFKEVMNIFVYVYRIIVHFSDFLKIFKCISTVIHTYIYVDMLHNITLKFYMLDILLTKFIVISFFKPIQYFFLLPFHSCTNWTFYTVC